MIGPYPPIQPGEYLLEEYLVPPGLTPYGLAKSCHVPRTRMERLAREETPVNADTDLRLARDFGTTPQFWMNMQVQYDLTLAQGKSADVDSIAPRAA